MPSSVVHTAAICRRSHRQQQRYDRRCKPSRLSRHKQTAAQSYREGALGLGAGKWRMVRTVVLPNAIDGIVTGCILAVGRIVGESAALLYTAGFGLVLNDFFTALHSSSATLTVALYVYANERGETAVAFSIATILMLLTLLINLSAVFLGRKLKKN